ncbi:hypothetical protein F443_18516 [Phytophthora nicotianae P1569]|uniref:Eukaryotic/viral aspartic protease n=1 Tax=Phytophthora nicotianae P1569 TaxID=1317065 RepID=V9E972_PHYNI|nr:hypothetical protein F443_18516 [Phytophthora nicotianae P1569]
MTLDVLPGESRGYWKYLAPDKRFKQAKAMGKINNEKALLLLDSGAETLECEGVGNSPYAMQGRTRIKITLAGNLVYLFDVWVGPPTGGQDLILGMDFMVPAGIRLDLADGTYCLPDEVRIHMYGRRPPYGEKIDKIEVRETRRIGPWRSAEIPLRQRSCDLMKLWVTRGDRWVPTFVLGPGKKCYLKITNVSDRVTLRALAKSGVSAAADEIDDAPEVIALPGPAVEQPSYATPTRILPRPKATSPGSMATSPESPKPLPSMGKTISAVTLQFIDRVADDTACHTRDESAPSRDQEFSAGCDSATKMRDRLTETGPSQIRTENETGSLLIGNQDRREETSFGQDRRAKTSYDQDRRMCVEQDRQKGTCARQDLQVEAETFWTRN